MLLSQAQWDAIRRVASEKARSVVDRSYKPLPAFCHEAQRMGFSVSQIEEIEAVAAATTKKAMNQKDNELPPVVFVSTDENLKNEAEELRRKAANLQFQLDNAEAEISRLMNHPISQWNVPCKADFSRKSSNEVPQRPKPSATPGARDGDCFWNGNELFIFFRGQWRRRSELEGYASAAKYL